MFGRVVDLKRGSAASHALWLGHMRRPVVQDQVDVQTARKVAVNRFQEAEVGRRIVRDVGGGHVAGVHIQCGHDRDGALRAVFELRPLRPAGRRRSPTSLVGCTPV